MTGIRALELLISENRWLNDYFEAIDSGETSKYCECNHCEFCAYNTLKNIVTNMESPAVIETNIPGASIRRGKVRDI